jgi:hypothetical protein
MRSGRNQAAAKRAKGDLDELFVSDAIEHPETLRALLDLGLDPTEEGASGRTPLTVAARLDQVEGAEILLAHGAVIDTEAADAVAQTDVHVRRGGWGRYAGADSVVLYRGAGLARDDPPAAQSRRRSGRARQCRHRPADYLDKRAGDPSQSAKIAEMLT